MKTMIISGGSKGIGEATVKRFLQERYQIIVLDIHKPTIENGHLHYFPCDISNAKEIETSAKTILAKFTRIDALVCNAGIHFSANILQSSLEDFDRLININLKSCFLLTQKFLPRMLEQKSGSIVYVGSDQTLIAKKKSTLYGMTKAALGSLAKTTALDFSAQNIRANTVAPSTIETELYHEAINKYCTRTGINKKQANEEEASELPIGRIGQAAEVANLIYFLCSDEASFITGTIIPVDGGYTAQ